jgi:hypothetical protein
LLPSPLQNAVGAGAANTDVDLDTTRMERMRAMPTDNLVTLEARRHTELREAFDRLNIGLEAMYRQGEEMRLQLNSIWTLMALLQVNRAAAFTRSTDGETWSGNVLPLRPEDRA